MIEKIQRIKAEIEALKVSKSEDLENIRIKYLRINALKSEFEDTHSESQNIDLTRTAYPIPLGSRHPLSLVKNEICDIFARLGFSIAEGPEIEDDWHVFSALNFAEDHPALPIFFFVHTPRLYKQERWSTPNPLSASFVRVVFTATKLYLTGHTAFSIK